MIVAFYFAKKRGYKTATDKLKMSEAMRVTLDALPSLFLIILWQHPLALGLRFGGDLILDRLLGPDELVDDLCQHPRCRWRGLDCHLR